MEQTQTGRRVSSGSRMLKPSDEVIDCLVQLGPWWRAGVRAGHLRPSVENLCHRRDPMERSVSVNNTTRAQWHAQLLAVVRGLDNDDASGAFVPTD